MSGVCLAEIGPRRRLRRRGRGARWRSILRGEPPIHEEGLEPLLRSHLGKRFTATGDLRRRGRTASDLTLIAVGTPFDGKRIDLTPSAGPPREIGAALRRRAAYHVVVVKSTVVPGTTDTVVRAILEEASGKRAGVDFGVGMNPEFLTEGQAVRDFMEPDRIVLGAIDERALESLDALYAPFRSVPRIRTNPRTAEMIKYASNALLATAISFSNEIANLCAALGGVDVMDVMEGAARLQLPHRARPGRRAGSRPRSPPSSPPAAGSAGAACPRT